MKIRLILTVLCLSIFCLSCTTYTKVAVTLEAAEDKGKVKVESKEGIKVYYDNIEHADDGYFGIKGNNKTSLDQQEVGRVYLAEGKIHKVKIVMINSPAIISGYLYDATDTSLIVSSSMTLIEDQSTIKLNMLSVPVADIKKVRLRKKGSVGKGYLIGTSIGIGTGIIIGLAASGTGFEVFAAAGTLGIVGSILGTPIGAIFGTKRFRIEGNQEVYDGYKGIFKRSSIVGR